MLFVTIACGAISGWHALIGSVSTSRQIENETDMLPVGGGAMFSEFTLGLLSLLAVATVVPTAGVAAQNRFAQGIGNFLSVFGIPTTYGTAIGLAAFVQLLFRVMRVTLAEWLGDRYPVFRSIHVGTLVSMVATFLLVISGTWIYIWQLFGAANQLMASLSLLIVTVWLVSTRRNALYAGIPAVFMYVTTMAATLVTAYNLYQTVFQKQLSGGYFIAVAGSLVTIAIAILLFVAAAFIAVDGYRAIQRYREQPPETQRAPAPGPAAS
jgi:carbon starvation protein